MRNGSNQLQNLENPVIFFNFVVCGVVAKWSGSGLQNRERRFESGRHLFFFQIINSIIWEPHRI